MDHRTCAAKRRSMAPNRSNPSAPPRAFASGSATRVMKATPPIQCTTERTWSARARTTSSMSHSRLARRASVHDRVVLGTVDDQEAREPALDPRERMIHDGIATGALHLEVDDRRAARRNRRCLYPGDRWRREAAALIDMIENLSDDVERGGEIRAADAEIDADCFADAGLQRMRFRQGADGAVEDKILRTLGDQLVVVHFLIAVRTEGLRRIDLALHEIEFAIDLQRPSLGFDEDHSVHAVGDVLRHAGRRAVVDEQTRDQ